MTDESPQPQEPEQEQEQKPEHPLVKPAESSIKTSRPYKLSRKHKRFADAYLLTLNASEAYRLVYKPKDPSDAHKIAYRILKHDGVRRYVDEALQESSEAEYRPEAIKQGIQTLAMTARRESDRLRAYELMSKISGLLTEGNQTQVNVFTDDIIALAKKRLSDRKKDAQKPDVTHPESSQVIDTKEDTDPMSYNSGYGQTVQAESVLSANDDSSGGNVDAIDSSDNGTGSDEGRPGEGTVGTHAHPSK